VKGPKLEEWQRLCSLAATEQDHDKLTVLIQEICRLLDEKEQRLRNTSAKTQSELKE
jgi:hypothetical protein